MDVQNYTKIFFENPFLLLTDTTAIIPKMTAIHAIVIARQGSNVTLQCLGRKVNPIDTEVQWKFNGQIIKDDTNKKATEKYPLAHEKRKVVFSLHITNVSEKDVGKYACKASVSDFQKANVDEDFIELSLYKKGEFHKLVLLSCKVPLTYSLPMALKGSLLSCFFNALKDTDKNVLFSVLRARLIGINPE